MGTGTSRQICIAGCKEEFRPSGFGLDHEAPRLFVTSQCGPKLFYLGWSVFWTVYHIVWISLDGYSYSVETGRSWMWFTYMSNWAYFALTIMVICDCAAVSYVWFRRRDILNDDESLMPWYLRTVWALCNISNATALVTSLIYWILLNSNTTPRSINKHVINSVFTVSNLIVTAKPVRVYHLYQPVVLCSLYLLFTLVYQKAAGLGIIYSFVDWDDPAKTLSVLLPLLLIGIPLAHLFLYAVYRLRRFIGQTCCSPEPVEPGHLRVRRGEETRWETMWRTRV